MQFPGYIIVESSGTLNKGRLDRFRGALKDEHLILAVEQLGMERDDNVCFTLEGVEWTISSVSLPSARLLWNVPEDPHDEVMYLLVFHDEAVCPEGTYHYMRVRTEDRDSMPGFGLRAIDAGRYMWNLLTSVQ